MLSKSLTVVLLIVIASFNTASAQLYKQAAGIRVGSTTPAIKTGITYRHFLNESNAIEGIISLTDGAGICALYELHKPTTIENLNWFYGAGGYIAGSNKTTYVGGAGIIGLDYLFPQVPINLSLDWKPELNIVERLYFEGTTFGFSIRYAF